MERYWWIVVHCVIAGKAVWCQDPCDTANHQEFPTYEMGSRNEICTASPREICDYYLQDGWYTISEGILLNRCPVEGTCGVAYPVWVQGEFPAADGGIVEASACININGDCCAQNLTIHLKNCSTYMVYNLRSLPFCSSVYCIETRLTCNGKSFETSETTQHMSLTSTPKLESSSAVDLPKPTSPPTTTTVEWTKPSSPDTEHQKTIPYSDNLGFWEGIVIGGVVSLVLWLAITFAIIVVRFRKKRPAAEDIEKKPDDVYFTCPTVGEDKQPYDYIKV